MIPDTSFEGDPQAHGDGSNAAKYAKDHYSSKIGIHCFSSNLSVHLRPYEPSVFHFFQATSTSLYGQSKGLVVAVFIN